MGKFIRTNIRLFSDKEMDYPKALKTIILVIQDNKLNYCKQLNKLDVIKGVKDTIKEPKDTVGDICRRLKFYI